MIPSSGGLSAVREEGVAGKLKQWRDGVTKGLHDSAATFVGLGSIRIFSLIEWSPD
jgi:hypothetical protein